MPSTVKTRMDKRTKAIFPNNGSHATSYVASGDVSFAEDKSYAELTGTVDRP